MLKGFKSKNQCLFAYYLTSVIWGLCVMMCLVIGYFMYRLTIFHLARIVFLILFCFVSRQFLFNVFWIMFNRTLSVRGNTEVYLESLKHFEKMTIYKQSKNYNKHILFIIQQSCEKLEEEKEEREDGGAVKEHKQTRYERQVLIKWFVLTVVCIAGILFVNQMESRKYADMETAYNARRILSDPRYEDLNILYKKDMGNIAVAIADRDNMFFYYVFEREEMPGQEYYYKTFYCDDKEYIKHSPYVNVVHGQMNSSQMKLSKRRGIFELSEEFPAIGIVTEDSINKVSLSGGKKPDDILQITDGKDIYYIWFFEKVTDKEATDFWLDYYETEG